MSLFNGVVHGIAKDFTEDGAVGANGLAEHGRQFCPEARS